MAPADVELRHDVFFLRVRVVGDGIVLVKVHSSDREGIKVVAGP